MIERKKKTNLLNRAMTYFSVFMRFRSSSSCTVSRPACTPEKMHTAIKNAIRNIVNSREKIDDDT